MKNQYAELQFLFPALKSPSDCVELTASCDMNSALRHEMHRLSDNPTADVFPNACCFEVHSKCRTNACSISFRLNPERMMSMHRGKFCCIESVFFSDVPSTFCLMKRPGPVCGTRIRSTVDKGHSGDPLLRKPDLSAELIPAGTPGNGPLRFPNGLFILFFGTKLIFLYVARKPIRQYININRKMQFLTLT